MPPSSYKMQYTPIPLDPKMIRHDLRTLMRRQDYMPQRDTPRQTHMVINEIWQFVTLAVAHVQNGEPLQALMRLQVITDVYTNQWMHLNDIHGEASSFFQDLARVWTETLLGVDLTVKERNRWTKQFAIWQARLAGVSIRAAFDAPQAALREGWDDAQLQGVLQGISLQPRAWEGEVPAYVPLLTHARLTVLEQRDQFQEYLALAKAEGDTRAYVTMLVRQGQIAEAFSYGYQHLTAAEDAFALAQALWTYNEPSLSLQIAAHGLDLEGNRVPLAIWLRDQAWSRSEQIQAMEAGAIAFRSEPTLEQYLRMTPMAGTQWPEQRARLLAYARQAPWTSDPQEVLRIFLHEYLFDDAIAVLKTTTSHRLVAQVVDAALKEQTALEWVIQACRQQAEHIMNGAKASYYQAAALWLAKARTGYCLLGRDEAWRAYLHDLLVRHQHKSKLQPLLRALQGEENTYVEQ